MTYLFVQQVALWEHFLEFPNTQFVVYNEMGSNVFEDITELLTEGFDLSEITLVCPTTIDPRVPNLFSKSIFFTRPHSASVLLKAEFNHSSLIHSGPQAANAALDFLWP